MPACPSRLAAISCGWSALPNGSFRSASSPEVPGIVRDRAEPGLDFPRSPPAPLPVTWLLARLSLPRSRAGGLGDAGSACFETATTSSGRLPPGEATRLPPPPSPFIFSLLFHVLPFNTPLGQNSSPSSLHPPRFPVSHPPTWQRGNFLTPEKPFLSFSLFSPTAPGHTPAGKAQTSAAHFPLPRCLREWRLQRVHLHIALVTSDSCRPLACCCAWWS